MVTEINRGYISLMFHLHVLFTWWLTNVNLGYGFGLMTSKSQSPFATNNGAWNTNYAAMVHPSKMFGTGRMALHIEHNCDKIRAGGGGGGIRYGSLHMAREYKYFVKCGTFQLVLELLTWEQEIHVHYTDGYDCWTRKPQRWFTGRKLFQLL